MPIISIEIGKLSREQKLGLIEKLTAVSSSVTGIPAAAFTVVINEQDDDNIGVGGKPLGEIRKK